MSAPATPAPTHDDQAVAPQETGNLRLAGWWSKPALMTALGLLALVVFGILGYAGLDSTFRLASARDLVELPHLTVPSQSTAIVLSIFTLGLAGESWYLAARGRRIPVQIPVLFGVFWVAAFLTWVVAGQDFPLTSVLSATLALAVPLVFGGLAGVLSERSGVINIAIEGQLLFGAFGAALVGSIVGSPWAGVVAAPIVALGIGAMLALFSVKYFVQQIIVGVVLNVFAIGLTSFIAGTLMSDNPQTFNTPMSLPNMPIPLLSEIPVIGPVLFNQNILVYLMYVIVALVTFSLFRTRWGLRVRAVGEHPQAADTVGIDVPAVRWRNVLLGSAVAGLGGATFTLGTGVAFSENMSAGNGYIAMAAMILGRYHPIGTVYAALLFAFATALQGQLGILQTSAVSSGLDKVAINGNFLLMLPYVVTLLAVAGLVGRVRPPAANGTPYIKQ